MKQIAIPTKEGSVDDHFGHCAYYTLYQIDESGQPVQEERLESPQGCGCKSNIANTLREKGVTIMLAGNMGNGAYKKLSEQGIQVIRGCHGKTDEVLRLYLKGDLKDSQEACDHHDCHDSGKPAFTYISATSSK